MLSYVAVVATYNRKDALQKSLQHLIDQSIQPKKIVVIDNHSTDSTYGDVIESFITQYPHLIAYYRLKENLGGSAGFYYGMREAMQFTPDLIALSDDDAYYDYDYFVNIIKTAEEHPEVQAFSGCVKTYGKVAPGPAKFLINDKTLRFKHTTVADYQHEFYCDAFSFVGPVYRTSLIKQIGFPNKDFFIWYDDTEYSMRMHQLGYQYLDVPTAVVNHAEKEQPKISLWKEYYGFRNELWSVKRYSSSKAYANLYPEYMYLRKCVAVFLKPHYRGHEKDALRIFTKAFRDAEANHLGKTIQPGSI